MQGPKVVACWVPGTARKARRLEYSKRHKEEGAGLGREI